MSLSKFLPLLLSFLKFYCPLSMSRIISCWRCNNNSIFRLNLDNFGGMNELPIFNNVKLKSNSRSSLGVSFSPGLEIFVMLILYILIAGLLTPFHIGAASRLKELGIIDTKTALSGSSGGALAAATAALNIDSALCLKSCCYIAKRCRDEGTRLTLRRALDVVLNEVLPENAHQILKERKSPCVIAFTEVVPVLRPHFVDEFYDKSDLIDCLRASCNIPFYFNGNSPFVTVRKISAVDGFFTVDLPRFGCPPTGAEDMEIIVCPYPASQIGLSPSFSFNNNILDRRDDQNRVPISIDSYFDNKENNCKYELITPDLLKGTDKWPFNRLDMLRMSLGPPSPLQPTGLMVTDQEIEEIYDLLYQAGREAVTVWNKNKSM